MMSDRRLEHDWFDRPLPANVVVGDRSWIYSAYAFLHYRSERRHGVRIGHDTGIYNGTFFDLGPNAQVVIGNYCSIVGAIFATNGTVVVGDYAFIAHEVTVADSFAAVPFERGGSEMCGTRAGAGGLSEPAVVIEENGWIGARVAVLAGARIGQGAVVGAGSVVDFDVPAYAIVAGNPAQVVGWCHRPA
jgi:acetyltransferase-like isoleucine patch superfamily enzyme